MPDVTRDKALELMADEVREKFDADELLEVHNELFPDAPSKLEEAHQDSGPLVERLVGYFNSGLGMDQILDLWGMIFPRHRNVWYDEEEERIHYNEGAEAVSTE